MVEVRKHTYQPGVHMPVIRSADPAALLQELGVEMRILKQKLDTFGDSKDDYMYSEESRDTVYVGSDPEVRKLEERMDHVGRQSADAIRSYLLGSPAVDLNILVPFPNKYLEMAVRQMPYSESMKWANSLGITIDTPLVRNAKRRR